MAFFPPYFRPIPDSNTAAEELRHYVFHRRRRRTITTAITVKSKYRGVRVYNPSRVTHPRRISRTVILYDTTGTQIPGNIKK